MKDDRTKNLWFKRRRYGWGWTPVTWQGAASIVLFLCIVIAAAFQLPEKGTPATAGQLMLFFGAFAFALIGLILVGIIKGPMPRWRWGKKPGDNPDEDI